MKQKKKKPGGSRKGSGRKKMEGRKKATFSLSDQVLDYVEYYSKGTGYPKNSLVNDLLLSALSSKNPDFEYCPRCGNPVLYLPIINISSSIHIDCSNCNHLYDIEI